MKFEKKIGMFHSTTCLNNKIWMKYIKDGKKRMKNKSTKQFNLSTINSCETKRKNIIKKEWNNAYLKKNQPES